MNTDTPANSLCMCCMSIKTGVGICQYCGFDENNYQPSPHHLSIRSILNGKYLIGRVLGEGGFGITYLAWDLNLDLKIAIKEYYPTGFVTRENTTSNTVNPFTGEKNLFFQSGREKFVYEARRLAKFYSLPGIVSIKDFFLENGTAYIVMEYVDGETFKQYLARMGGKIPTVLMFDMIRPLMNSLMEIHKVGIIHRDISPDNIMLTKEGNIKLLDFGSARDFADVGNKSISVMLKPGYAPEEQYRSRGVQGPWTDIYALCATIYKAITGITPDESSERLRHDELKKPSELGIVITPTQEAVLMKGMAVLQEYRYQSIGEFSNALYETNDQDITNPIPISNTNTLVQKDVETQPKPYYNIETEEQSTRKSKKITLLKKIILISTICLVALILVFTIKNAFNEYSNNYNQEETITQQTLETNSSENFAPTFMASILPTNIPTTKPTTKPTTGPITEPTTMPTIMPTAKPTAKPTAMPTSKPSSKPTAIPTAKPTAMPTAIPDARIETNTVGNSALNISLLTSVAKQGDWIYYCIGEGIYRMKADGSGVEKLFSIYGYGLNVLGEYLYYITGYGNIRRLNLITLQEEILADNNGSKLWVMDGNIYNFSNNTLNKTKLDGSQEERIMGIPDGDLSFYSTIYKDNIYFITYDENFASSVYKISIDGGTPYLLISVDNYFCDIVVYNDKLYISEYGEALWQSDLDGSNLTQVIVNNDSITGFYYMTIYNDYLIYPKDNTIVLQSITGSNTGYSITIGYKDPNLNGVFDDWIYYSANDSMHRTKLDGSITETLLTY